MTLDRWIVQSSLDGTGPVKESLVVPMRAPSVPFPFGSKEVRGE
jgi:hypothetical protein